MIPLRTSQVVYFAVVVTLMVTVAAGLGFWFIRKQMLAGNDFMLHAVSKEILVRLARIAPPIDAERIEAALREHAKNDEALFYFQVHEPAGKVLYHSTNLGESALRDLTGGLDKRTMNVPPLRLVRAAQYHTPTLHAQIATSLRHFQSINNSFLRVFLRAFR